MKDTKISWCHHTINFWMGCKEISPEAECKGCYAREQMKQHKENFGVLRLTQGPWREAEILNARARAMNTYELVFTCSMSDFFHEQADPWREEAWDVIRRCRNLIWLVLTKRPERIHHHLPEGWNGGNGFPHVWLGTTCGVPESYNRVDALRKIDCKLRFLSCEPLMNDISTIKLEGIGWVLCGGMSGDCSESDPMQLSWAASLYDTTQRAGVPFLFKQISRYKPEQGINALGLYLAHVAGKKADPESVDCIRRYPQLEGFPIAPTGVKGARLSQAEWDEYMKPREASKVKRKKVPTGTKPESESAAQHQPD
jgi:protein gp37